MNVIREERGWAGHFICAHRCLFRRNTLLTRIEAVGIGKGDPSRVGLDTTRIVVSTVGNMHLDLPGRPGEVEKSVEIAANRWYETMAFLARFDDPYWDADVSQKIRFDAPWGIWHPPSEDSDAEANAMHEVVVEELTMRLDAGERFIRVRTQRRTQRRTPPGKPFDPC